MKNDFLKTFNFLNEILGEKSFKKYDGSEFKGKFLESAYESVAVGLGANIKSYNLPDDKELILSKIKAFYAEDIYRTYAGSGSNAKSRIPKLVPFSIEYFKK